MRLEPADLPTSQYLQSEANPLVDLAFVTCEAELEGDHDRTAGLLFDAVIPAWRVALKVLRDLAPVDPVVVSAIIRCADGDNTVVVEQVVDTELDLGAVEDRAAADVVVHEDIVHPERIFWNSLVKALDVGIASANALAEDTEIDALVLIGRTHRFRIVRR